jgi:hypothetical protein
MPNLRLAPGVTAKRAKRAKRGRRRRTRSGSGGLRGWLQVIRFVLIMKRLRRQKRSSPSVGQIVLVVASGGLAIVIIRGMSRRVAARRARSADGETRDQVPAPQAPLEPTTPGAADALTERVRAEMFQNKN